MDGWLVWVVAGLLLLIAELFTPGFVLAVFGAACLAAAPFSYYGCDMKWQLLAFGVITAVMALAVRPLVMRSIYRKGHQAATNVDALAGTEGLVLEAIASRHHPGRVKVMGDDWSARSADGSPIAAGIHVRILRVEGCRVIVEPIERKQETT